MLPSSLSAAHGRVVKEEDTVTSAPVARLMAAFGREEPPPVEGDPLPPLWHGLFCSASLPPSRLGPDGLARDEGLLPSVREYPVRLFGGARYRFDRPLRIGDRIRKESEMVSFDLKQGRRGAFVVGLVRHRIHGPAGLAVTEENDIIFRPAGAPRGSKSRPAGGPPADAIWSETVTPDPVLMFRHSAVTFNSHRVHYDRDFARARGYPGLLVQGALIARLMLELVRRKKPEFTVFGFSFRSGHPIYDDGDFTLRGMPDGERIALWATDHAGAIGMTAEAVGRQGSGVSPVIQP